MQLPSNLPCACAPPSTATSCPNGRCQACTADRLVVYWYAPLRAWLCAACWPSWGRLEPIPSDSAGRHISPLVRVSPTTVESN